MNETLKSKLRLLASEDAQEQSSPSVCLYARKFREGLPRRRPEHHVMVGQVNRDAVEADRDHRAGGKARRVVGAEHEAVDEKLRTGGKVQAFGRARARR